MSLPRTPQAIFNRVWRHFIVERNPRSVSLNVSDSPTCAYRGPDGARCAVGLFMPDEVYRPTLECDGIGLVIEMLPAGEFRDWCVRHATLLEKLQDAHDYSGDREGFEHELRNLAYDEGLDLPATESRS